MPHWHFRAALQMRNTPDVGRDDLGGRTGLQVAEFTIAQLRGQFRLQNAVGASRTAAQVGVAGGQLHVEA